MEFHISRQARDHYQFDLSLFSYDGNVIFANFHAARLFSQKMNLKRDLLAFPEQAVKASHINAMGLLDELLHLVVHKYQIQKNLLVFSKLIDYLNSNIGPETVDKVLKAFIEEFPPVDVYNNKITTDDYIEQSNGGIPNRHALLEELILLWISNQNPALQPYQELFGDSSLLTSTAYNKIIQQTYSFFETQAKYGPQSLNLIDVLQAPARAHPNSLLDQLEFIRLYWAEIIGENLQRLLSSLDFFEEENKPVFFGPGPVEVPVYFQSANEEEENENFSPDRDWMPRLVLIAKNTYVWLDQLSKQYEQPINRLDQIPDQELDRLAAAGFTGLWLIGLWERSRASAHIKQLCGNPEAISSAYSLMRYEIADDIGGVSAYQNLRDRAGLRGIRLASDMVPNHMAIDSDWVRDHPNWFVGVDYSPFPSYTFSGPDLSHDGRFGIYLEDHYYNRSDAAVVFKRIERSTGQEHFIYHGNDGTSMPWNDTAQLNYLIPEVREAVIQVILHVAHQFPIIRFDAAMTLAKRQFQRLWFPEPGSGGAIPSRAEFGLNREQFNLVFPEEFWREVVERVAREAPDTLLLAEAFWMMEGYFVRTLGMHRVYNSAFMNMLRDEENGKYRKLIKNTLEFEPEILKRYVNFMNNPDERTAIDQFGDGDKYFGICVLMSTMPGLPMFGHGQIEGFNEKYGMEYRRAYQNETPNPWLIDRHNRQIFPLLHRRSVFAGVENFQLYDFLTSSGWVNEDVYAYSNRSGSNQAIVIYHNKFAETSGQIKFSVPFKAEQGLARRTLIEGLQIKPDVNKYITFRDQISGLEFIRSSQDLAEHGLYLILHAYSCHVFLDFREVKDDENNSYRNLNQNLAGKGTPSLQEALQEMWLGPGVKLIKEIINPGYFQYLMANRTNSETAMVPERVFQEAETKLNPVLISINRNSVNESRFGEIKSSTNRILNFILTLPTSDRNLVSSTPNRSIKALEFFMQGLTRHNSRWYGLFALAFVLNFGRLESDTAADDENITMVESWRVPQLLVHTANEAGFSPEDSGQLSQQLKLAISQRHWYSKMGSFDVGRISQVWFSLPEIQQFLGVNRFKDILWFNHENFEDFMWWMMASALIEAVDTPASTRSQVLETLLGSYEIIQAFLEAEATSECQLLSLTNILNLGMENSKPQSTKTGTSQG